MPTVPELRKVVQRVVALEYGQFYLLGRAPSELSEAIEALLHQALTGVGIAAAGEAVVVCSPHPHNYTMRLRLESWSALPADDRDLWEEVFSASIVVGSAGLIYSSPTAGDEIFDVEPGRYALRISGVGFVAPGNADYLDPRDRWRVQFWPTDRVLPAQRVKEWSPPAQRSAEEWQGIICNRPGPWGLAGRTYVDVKRIPAPDWDDAQDIRVRLAVERLSQRLWGYFAWGPDGMPDDELWRRPAFAWEISLAREYLDSASVRVRSFVRTWLALADTVDELVAQLARERGISDVD